MCPKLENSAAVKKDNNNKYLTFNTNFDIQRPVQMTGTRHKIGTGISVDETHHID